MKARRIKVIWGASRVIRGRWYLGVLGVYERRPGHPRSGIAISVRGVLAWIGALAVVAYIAGATALFWLWQRNPYSLLTYTDALLYPVRRSEIAVKHGRAFIARGTDLFREKKYFDAANLLRLGLARYPRDSAARLLLAQYYVLANQRPLALSVLQDGLTDTYPGRAYLEALIGAAEQGEDYDAIVRTCQRYRTRLDGESALRDRVWLHAKLFAALSAAGRHEEALALASEGAGNAANEQRVLALLALNRAEEALAFLREWRAQAERSDGVIVDRLEARALREANRLDEMEQVLNRFRETAPAAPAPLVYGVVQRAMAGLDAAAREALDTYVFRFGGSAANLLLVAGPLAEIGNLPLLQRCIEAAAERGYAMHPFQTLLVQTHVQRGEWDAAARVVAAMPPPAGRNAVAGQLWHDWMEHLIAAARTPADAPQSALLEFLRSRPWPIRIFRHTIEALQKAERLATARDAAVLAARVFPASAWLQTVRTDLDARLAQAEKVLADAEGPAPATTVRGEKQFFNELDTLVAAQDWARVDALLREARNPAMPPPWATAREGDLRFVEIRSAQARADRLAMVGAVKLFLNGSPERARRLTDLAKEIHGDGDHDGGLALLREVVRLSPNYPPARRLLEAWEPKPAEKK